jgi:amino acid transporter
VHKRFLTPTFSTVVMGAVSIVLYVAMNYLSTGSSVIGDSVSALGTMIAFYYGLTGFACFWYYRKHLTESTRSLWLRGILPLLGGLILWFTMFWFLWYNWTTPNNSYTTWKFPGTDRVIGGVFVIDIGAILLGIVLYLIYRSVRPAYFRGEVLNRDTPTKVPEGLGVPVGLFGIDESQPPADALPPSSAG